MCGSGGGDNSAAIVGQQQNLLMQMIMFSKQQEYQAQQDAKNDEWRLKQEEESRLAREETARMRETYEKMFNDNENKDMSADLAAVMNPDSPEKRKQMSMGTKRFLIPTASKSPNSTEAGLTVPK
jgi:hypothetical protein